MTPEDYAKSGTEHSQQVALMIWTNDERVKKVYPELQLLFAIPNGGLRGKAQAGMLKAEGVKAGISDLLLPVKRGKFSGLFIEMKKPKGKTPAGKASKEQLAFGDAVMNQGYGFIVCDSWDKARDMLIAYLEQV